MRTAVVFLQNAWSPIYAGGTWQRRSWLKALHASRSGQRLRVLSENCPSVELWFDNTTPIVGAEPSSVIEADLDYMDSVLGAKSADYVVTLGKQAATAVMELGLTRTPVLACPHPAYRVLTNALYAKAGKMLEEGFRGWVNLEQGRSRVLTTERVLA